MPKIQRGAVIAIALVIVTILILVYLLPHERKGFIGKLTHQEPQIVADLSLSYDNAYISPGQTIIAQLTLIQLRDMPRRDVTVKTHLEDEEGNIITSEEQTVALESQSSLVIELNTPQENNAEHMKLISRVYDTRTGNLIGEASQRVFSDEQPLFSPNKRDTLLLITLGVCAFLIILITVIRLLGVKIPEKANPKKQTK